MGGLVSAVGGAMGFGGPSGTGPSAPQAFAPYMGSQFTNLNNFESSPFLSALQGQASSQVMPGNVTAAPSNFQADPYQAKDMSNSPLPQYDAMRERINSQYSQTQSQAQDSLDRQFAAMGGGPGNGAQAKQTENLATGIAQQKGQDLLGVNAQEAQTRTGLQQQQQLEAYQSGETQKGYGFASSQSDLQRQLQAQEFNSQQQLAVNSAKFGQQATIAQMGMGFQQAQAEANNNQFNTALQTYQAQHSGGLLGAGGFLGTGL